LDNYIELLKMILPSVLVEHFDLVKSEKIGEQLHLFFEEKADQAKEFSSLSLISKGFYNEVTVQDFPLRGQFVFLHIKRRRWTDKTNNTIVQRDWDLVAKGTRYTEDFSAFLKEINRY
jgi:hypothetical protein